MHNNSIGCLDKILHVYTISVLKPLGLSTQSVKSVLWLLVEGFSLISSGEDCVHSFAETNIFLFKAAYTL